jgi:hypothetical protein
VPLVRHGPPVRAHISSPVTTARADHAATKCERIGKLSGKRSAFMTVLWMQMIASRHIRRSRQRWERICASVIDVSPCAGYKDRGRRVADQRAFGMGCRCSPPIG